MLTVSGSGRLGHDAGDSRNRAGSNGCSDGLCSGSDQREFQARLPEKESTRQDAAPRHPLVAVVFQSGYGLIR